MTRSAIIILALITAILLFSCGKKRHKKESFKGIDLRQTTNNKKKPTGIQFNLPDSLMRSGKIVLTNYPQHRLVPTYKVNYDKRRKYSYIGGIGYHTSNSHYTDDVNNKWHNHYMPGFSAMYGYNMINVAHYNLKENKKTNCFESPTLVNTVYYPSLKKDTLNGKQVVRDYMMISVYDEDTNMDSLINRTDLRRFYQFDLNGNKLKAIVPPNYSVMNSRYDYINDIMYVYSKLDENENGKMDSGEPIHIFYFKLNSDSLDVVKML